jgi:hypothetical protein
MNGSLQLCEYPGDTVRLSCEKCGRSGQYRKQKLIERYGAAAPASHADIGCDFSLVVSLPRRSCVRIMAACGDGQWSLRPLTKYTRVFPIVTVGLLMTDGHLLGFLLFRDRSDW